MVELVDQGLLVVVVEDGTHHVEGRSHSCVDDDGGEVVVDEGAGPSRSGPSFSGPSFSVPSVEVGTGAGVGFSELPSAKTRLIVFSKGNFCPWHSPRKSSVSIDQIIAPPRFMAFANLVLMAILSMSSYPTHCRSR